MRLNSSLRHFAIVGITICATLIISGCGTPADARKEYIAQLGERCKSFGYYPNTAEYKNCLMTLDAANNSGGAAAAQQWCC